MTHPETPPIPAKKRNTRSWKTEAKALREDAETWAAKYHDESDRTATLSDALADALEAKGKLEGEQGALTTDVAFWQRVAIALETQYALRGRLVVVLFTVAMALAFWLGFR